MSTHAAASSASWPRWPLLGGIGLVIGLVGLVLGQGAPMEFSYGVFIAVAGLSMGSLGLLMIGHIMGEHWLAPVRSEAEAAGLTAPLLLLLGIPLASNLGQLFPWAGDEVALPGPRAVFLSSGFFILRSLFYLLVCSGLAIWLIRTGHLRRTSAFGLALLAPIMTFAAYDWVLSRDPQWWSSLFGFAFALSQLLAALAGGILITLLKPEHASPSRMVSLERALLTLCLLSVWTWFAQFLIVWLANLPHEADWYLQRSDQVSLMLIGASFVTMLAAILILIPSGVSRRGMIAGSFLVLLQHAIHLLWILQPDRNLYWLDVALAFGFAGFWGVAFTTLMQSRPSYAEETSRVS
jgi:uncharacterized membrane protein YjjB (DUF3815 family)